MSLIRSHEHVKAALLAYLETWVPIRLEMIRLELKVDEPGDPAAYLAMDTLPQNDPSKYPCIVVTSTSKVSGGTKRRQASASGEVAVFDVDYDVRIIVAVENSEFADDAAVAAHRDRLMRAVSECLLMPADLDEDTFILQSPVPEESTGAAVQTVRGNPLAAGTIDLRIRCTETLMPTSTLATVVSSIVTVDAVDADEPLAE